MPSSCRTIRLHSGLEIPRIGLGTFKSSTAEVGQSVSAALQVEPCIRQFFSTQHAPNKWHESSFPPPLQAGIRHIDTASVYKNQEAIGAALRAAAVPRAEVRENGREPFSSFRLRCRPKSLALDPLGPNLKPLDLSHTAGLPPWHACPGVLAP